MSSLAENLIAQVLSAGALRAAPIPASDVVTSAAFRDMCADNRCGMYGKCWVCPPAVGEIDDLMARIRTYDMGVLYQTVGELEDSFDIEGMIESKRVHSELSQRIEGMLRETFPGDYLHLSAGGCKLCERCAILDDKPCRFPDRAISSLEAYGIDVYQTTSKTPLRYINGQNTVTYFGLILYHE